MSSTKTPSIVGTIVIAQISNLHFDHKYCPAAEVLVIEEYVKPNNCLSYLGITNDEGELWLLFSMISKNDVPIGHDKDNIQSPYYAVYRRSVHHEKAVAELPDFWRKTLAEARVTYADAIASLVPHKRQSIR